MSGGPDALLDRLRRDEFEGDAEVLGGPSLIRACWERGAIDQLGLIVLPVLFGSGLPLFPLSTPTSTQALRLVDQRSHPDGSLELFYERQ
jgi:dihydrofolate reductase